MITNIATKDLLNATLEAFRKISFEFDTNCELQGFICQNMMYTKVTVNGKSVYLLDFYLPSLRMFPLSTM